MFRYIVNIMNLYNQNGLQLSTKTQGIHGIGGRFSRVKLSTVVLPSLTVEGHTPKCHKPTQLLQKLKQGRVLQYKFASCARARPHTTRPPQAHKSVNRRWIICPWAPGGTARCHSCSCRCWPWSGWVPFTSYHGVVCRRCRRRRAPGDHPGRPSGSDRRDGAEEHQDDGEKSKCRHDTPEDDDRSWPRCVSGFDFQFPNEDVPSRPSSVLWDLAGGRKMQQSPDSSRRGGVQCGSMRVRRAYI
jgi:hypothetical protein